MLQPQRVAFVQSLSLLLTILLPASRVAAEEPIVSYDGRAITVDGKRQLLLAGSIHYPRSVPEQWPELMARSKTAGINMLDTYVF
jgi:hypothetical protein